MADVREHMDLGTWGTFRTGWWIVHATGVLLVGYLGYRVGKG